MLIDIHVHTSEGSDCATVSVEDAIDELKRKGFDGVLITDHNSYKGYETYKSNNKHDDGFVVLRGIEYSTKYGHMLVILPEGKKIDIEYGIDTMKLIDKVHELGGVIGIAHMFRDRNSIGNNVTWR